MAATPIIYNLTLTNADTEYSQALAAGGSRVELKARTLADLKLAFISTESGTTYVSIFGGASYVLPENSRTRNTLYLQSPTAGAVVEIVEFR